MKNRKKLKNKIIIILIVALFLHIIMPLSTLAQNEATISNIEEVFEEIEEVEENFDYNEEQEEPEEEIVSCIEESESNIEEVLLETKEATTSNAKNNYEKNEYIEELEEQEDNFYIKESTPSDVEENEILLYEQVATLSDIKETTPSNAEDIIENINVEDLAKTWSVDDVTMYYFDIDGNGIMILPKHKYLFKYIIEKDKLILNFDDCSIKETTFIVSIVEEELILIRKEEVGQSKFILKKVID